MPSADTLEDSRNQESTSVTSTEHDAADWLIILGACGVRLDTARDWSTVFADTIHADTFSQGAQDLQYFLGQILHESELLERLEENLNYEHPERIMAVWPTRFPTLTDARFYVNNPEALANKVYGGRMGNVKPGDGWRYRGRGFPGITGLDGYRALSDLVGQDFVDLPELLVQPHFALEAGIHWWENRIPDSFLGDTVKVTRRVNGGLIGLAARESITNLAGKALA